MNKAMEQAKRDFAQLGSNENPYSYHSEDWWDYQLQFAQCCGDLAKVICEELKMGSLAPLI